MAKKKENKDEYSVTLLLNGKEYTAGAKTIEEALASLRPEFFKTRGVLTVTHGENKATRYMNIVQMKRTFGIAGTNTQRISLEVMSSNMRLLLGEK